MASNRTVSLPGTMLGLSAGHAFRARGWRAFRSKLRGAPGPGAGSPGGQYAAGHSDRRPYGTRWRRAASAENAKRSVLQSQPALRVFGSCMGVSCEDSGH
jgi:hypothetical protein